MPGIVEQRFNQLQEIEAILQYLNIELRRLRSKHFKKYPENYQRALSQVEMLKNMSTVSRDVVDYEKIINEFALLRNKWLGITKALDQKQWQITNITKLRVWEWKMQQYDHKAFVTAMKGRSFPEELAEDCIQQVKKFNIQVEKFNAVQLDEVVPSQKV